jgi:membrane associated rhomboid family serine protease
VFPIGDEHNGRRLTPFVNYGLISFNTLVFLYEVTLNRPELFDFIYRWGAIPVVVADGDRWFTLETSTFVHGGWLHLGGNMLFLWVFGDNVEDTMGHLGYLLFYLICGAAGSALHVFVNSDSRIPSSSSHTAGSRRWSSSGSCRSSSWCRPGSSSGSGSSSSS